MATDPVCGMSVMEEKARESGNTLEYEGRTYYFCAKGCLERFRKDPEKYLSEDAPDWIKG